MLVQYPVTIIMKIALIGQKGMPTKDGGVDRHVENLAIFLAAKNEKVIVYNRSDYLPEKISQWKGVKLVHLPYINNKNLAAITHGFLATIHAIRHKVDVIHFHGIGPSLLIIIPHIFAPKIRIISTLHSFDYGNDKWGTFAKFMLKVGERVMCKYADEVIVLTDMMKDYLWQEHKRDCVVIPNGAYVHKSDNTDKLKAFGLEPKKYIISVSRIIRLKGIQYVIQAFRNITDPDLKLVIVGDGEYLPELEKLAATDPRVVFAGNQSGEVLAQLYSHAKLFVQSSEMEGLSISLLEAMAYELPLLVSNIDANREAADEVAIFFQSKDVQNLQVKLVEALTNEERMNQLAKKAKERAERKYDWNAISADTISIYKK